MDIPANNDPKLLARQAVNFLATVIPDGPWTLSCIDANKKGVQTRTFYRDEAQAVQDFLLQWGGQKNLYYQANPVTDAFAQATHGRLVSKKAERADIREVRHLHVDIDCAKGVDLEQDKQRILARLTGGRPKGLPEPTVIVMSGGGHQALWTLDQSIRIDGNLALAEDTALYNKYLEQLLGGDHCHDISRLLRLPWTENIPDAKKAEKGRVRCLAKLLKGVGDTHTLSTFRKAAADVARDHELSTVDVKVGGVVRRLASIDELDEWRVPDRIKIICVQGNHPEQPKNGDNSRSGWLFDVCCNLARNNVPDDVIYSIITDPDFAISESVLVLGAAAPKYAIRQIERGKLHAIDPKLEEMNEKYAVVTVGGSKTKVARWGANKLDKGKTQVLLTQSFEDFRNGLLNEFVQVGTDAKGNPKYESAANWWLTHPRRRQYLSGMLYAPGEGRDLPGGFLNLFTGWGVEPKPGDWSLMRQHILENIAQGEEDHARYIERWCAWAVQHADDRAGVALVLQGRRGTGKGVFGSTLVRLFGHHGRHILQQDHIVGKFNAHLEYCSLLFADESFAPNQKQAESVLKGMVTEETLQIERKGVDSEAARNCLHIVAASNDEWVVPAAEDERRWAVFRMSDAHAQDHAYFKAIVDQLDNGGREAMLHDLLTMDLGDWHPRQNVPQTEALNRQKILTLRGVDKVMYQILASGNAAGCVARDQWGYRFFETAAVLKAHDLQSGAVRSLGLNLRAAIDEDHAESDRPSIPGRGQVRGWWLPPLERARANWVARKKFPAQWSTPFEWEDTDDLPVVERPRPDAMVGLEDPF